ncbi:hypothetical protein WAI453_002387 [Rhynchosporium graminicola]
MVSLSPFATRLGSLCGPIGLALLTTGWILAGFFPPFSPSATPEEVAAHYHKYESGIKACVPLWLAFGVLNIIFRATVSVSLSKIENCSKFLVRAQLAGSIYTGILSILAAMFFATAVLRPSRSPELIQLLNDAGQYTAVLDAQSMVIQDLAAACVILQDSSPSPIFPRWAGYALLSSVIALIPSYFARVELEGAYAWSGIIGFYVPSMIFGNDLCLLAWYVWKDAGNQGRAAHARQE